MKQTDLAKLIHSSKGREAQLEARWGGLTWEIQRKQKGACGVLDWKRIIVHLVAISSVISPSRPSPKSWQARMTSPQAALRRQIRQAVGQMAGTHFPELDVLEKSIGPACGAQAGRGEKSSRNHFSQPCKRKSCATANTEQMRNARKMAGGCDVLNQEREKRRKTANRD
jgi:hypothetical protein